MNNPTYQTRSSSTATFFRVVLGSAAHLSIEVEPDGRMLFIFDDVDGVCHRLGLAYHSTAGYAVDAKTLLDESFAMRGIIRMAHENGGTWENPNNA